METSTQTDFYTDLSLVEDPQPFYEKLRANGPVTWLPDRRVVAVTGFAEAVEIYNDSFNFSSINAVTGPIPDLPFEPQGDDISEQLEAHRDEMPFSREVVAVDAPDHGRMRSLLMPLFTPSKLKALEPRFRKTANELIDAFINQGEVEFIGSYASRLATLIITDLLGIPEDERAEFLKFFDGPPTGEIGGEARGVEDNPLIQRTLPRAAKSRARMC